MAGNPREKTQFLKRCKKDTIEIIYQYLRGINEMQIILLTWCDLSCFSLKRLVTPSHSQGSEEEGRAIRSRLRLRLGALNDSLVSGKGLHDACTLC